MTQLPSILDVWRALGGSELRRGRGRAFWRNGDGFNVKLDVEREVFFDHARGEGGGVLDLIEAPLETDRAGARRWLEQAFGIRRDLPPLAARRAYAECKAKAEADGEALRFIAWRAHRVNSLHAEAAAWSERLWAWIADTGPLAADGVATGGEALALIYATIRELESSTLDELVAEFRRTPIEDYAEELRWLRFGYWAIDEMARKGVA